MNDTYGMVIAIFLSVYLMFIAPLNQMIYESEKVEKMYITNEVTYFVEQVRNTGNISEEMYLNLEEKLSSLNKIYSLEFTCYKNIYNEDKSEVKYFEQCDYTTQVKKALITDKRYTFEKNEYLKVVVKEEDEIVCIYGGSIKNEADGL